MPRWVIICASGRPLTYEQGVVLFPSVKEAAHWMVSGDVRVEQYDPAAHATVKAWAGTVE